MTQVIRITKTLAEQMKGKQFDGTRYFSPQPDAVAPHWFVGKYTRDNCSKKLYPEIQKELAAAKLVDHNPIRYSIETGERIN